ncbi:uncharacterized protein LOC112552370 [Pogonomyrmex barbatus]|uniref:Uncharacterized protein LOC112552370 n=1 Tax=Pogonomyrmex barbatus TaxID=144034 RepID=A0A8N1S314_9HYME|nr:uncharacterized protein LOC112552370 [Pogonomyrmex barbatus]
MSRRNGDFSLPKEKDHLLQLDPGNDPGRSLPRRSIPTSCRGSRAALREIDAPQSSLFSRSERTLGCRSVNRNETYEGHLYGERRVEVLGHVRSITMAIAALGPPERTPGLVPSLLHSAFSAFPPRSMHAADDI